MNNDIKKLSPYYKLQGKPPDHKPQKISMSMNDKIMLDIMLFVKDNFDVDLFKTDVGRKFLKKIKKNRY